jgi:uncharacterized damage-inducible protein DinB
MSTDNSTLVSGLKTNSQLYKKATDGIPAEKWLIRPSDDSNHLLWIAGHIVAHRAIMSKLLGRQWSAPWETLFVRGAKLAAPEELPSVEEIQRAWGEVSEMLKTSLASAPAEVLARPVEKQVPSFDGTIGGSIAFLSLHETYHMGQMSYLRKWLGYGQVVG